MTETGASGQLPDVRDLLERLAQRGLHLPSRPIKIGTFGDSPEMSRELLELIRQGRKTATASLVWEWEAEGQSLPMAGDLGIVLDGSGAPVLVLEYLEALVVPFSSVSEDFARDEGEGDGSLEFWREVHLAFFTRACRPLERVPSQDMPIVCARFRVLYDVG